MADQKKPLFAAIPLQAIGDRRLSAAHFQVLAIIAWHDQFGANGIGCYASLKTLAKETGLAQTTVSECTGDLEAFGLLAKARHPLNRRTKVYSLIYKGNPRILPETGNCSQSQDSDDTKLPASGNDPGATLRVENREVPETVEQTGFKYITRSVREKIEESGRQGKSSYSARLREPKKSRKADDDSIINIEAKKTREAKRSREALAFRKKWQTWLREKYRFATRAAVIRVGIWEQAANGDYELLERILTDADRAGIKGSDVILAHVGEQLGIPDSPW